MAVIIQNPSFIKFNQGGRTLLFRMVKFKRYSRFHCFCPNKKIMMLPRNVERTPLEEREKDGYQRNAQISRQRVIFQDTFIY